MKVVFCKYILALSLLGVLGANPCTAQSSRLYTLPDSGIGPIIGLYQEAEQSIYLAAYVITDSRFTSALVDASHRGVRITVLLDEGQARRNKYSQHRRFEGRDINVLALSPRAGQLISDFGLVDNSIIYTGGALLHSDMEANPKRGGYLIVRSDPILVEQYLNLFRTLQQTAGPVH